MTPRILIVDDDSHIREVITFALEAAGMVCRIASDGAGALAAFGQEEPDMMILDVGIPNLDGFEVCRKIRRTSEVPILFLTARDDEIDRVVGLEIGGDDYVTKPFSPRELTARVRAILKRSAAASEPVTSDIRTHGRLSLDPERHSCRYDDEEVHLTQSEFSLLSRLIARPEMVHSRAQLLDQLYGPNIHVSDRTLDSHIRNLRAKLAQAGCRQAITTVRGVGVRLGSCQD